MKYIKLFEEHDVVPYSEEIPLSPSENVPEPDQPGYYGKKGKDFYDFIMDPHDGPVDQFVIISRAFKYALNRLTKMDAEMCANVFEMALTELKKEGGRIASTEPVGKYE
jgi:hypothetical protein